MIDVLVPLSGVFVTVEDYNIDECVKMEGNVNGDPS